MAARRQSSETAKNIRPPATTPEGRENQLVAAAYDLAEKQLLEGTASAQVITHMLKTGSRREKLEREKLERENELLRAKVEQIADSKTSQLVYQEALRAMRRYQGHEETEDDYS